MSDLAVPDGVLAVLDTLWSQGFAAFVVGGGVRDTLLGRPVPQDWDVATSALPEQVREALPRGRYENRFGTVLLTIDPHLVAEITTFRRDHRYADHRRPDSVTFTDSVDDDLLRRDFTVNAIAWGRRPDETGPHFVDPTNGMADLDSRLLRAVGEPAQRFDEDGLRLLRAARFAAQLGFEIERRTLNGMRAAAETVKWVSQERVGGELRRMVAADPPSEAFKVLADTGVLEHALPELAAQRGVPQDKVPGMDLWGHALATLDAAAQIDHDNLRLRLTALLHDIGKPSTFADGHFVGHDMQGARLADELLGRLAFPRRETEPIAKLIGEHMFSYEPRWSSAAVRRFIRRIGRNLVEDLLNLRVADNLGSGQPADATGVELLRQRVHQELRSDPPLDLADLAIRGDDLMTALSLRPGPLVGDLLERLLGLVIADPALNSRDALIDHARTWLAEDRG